MKKNWINQVSLRNTESMIWKMVQMGLSYEVEEQWQNIKQSIIEVNREMIGGKKKKQRNEEWYNDERRRATKNKNIAR